MEPQVVASSTLLSEPEPQLDTCSPTDSTTIKNKNNGRKSLDANEVKKMKDEPKEEDGASILEEPEGKNQERAEAAATEDDSRLSVLERSSSLNTIKASGTRAVGSLFSKFKVGRKKSQPSAKDSTVEHVDSSPMKTVEEKFVGDFSKIVNTDVKEQTVGVSGKQDKSNLVEEKTRKEKAEVFEESDKVQDLCTGNAASDDSKITESTDAACNDEMATEVTTTGVAGVVTEESVQTDKITTNSVLVDASVLTAASLGKDIADKTVGASVLSVETLSTELSITVETNESTNGKLQDKHEVSGVATKKLNKEDRHHTVHSEPIPLELDLGRDLDIESASATYSKPKVDTWMQSKEVSPDVLKTEAVEADESNDNSQSDDTSTHETIAVQSSVTESLINDVLTKETAESDAAVINKAASAEAEVNDLKSKHNLSDNSELLTVKIASSTYQLPVEGAAVAEPEKMSPVKSLASRFEGKREQNLDSLKFRTLREFFPEERSIHVEAEKKKYEAQVQQKFKTKVEDEVKSKSKSGSSLVASEVKAVSDAIPFKSIEEKAVITTDVVDFTTPETTASQEKPGLDKVGAPTNLPDKTNEDDQKALTPVKSIASRFEGKREQSLDSLKFRTVRGFFPEERSVRVGSEKQKFEAQAQHDTSLDSLKFRTLRNFFTDEGKRSVHVGAEKAKFEALTRQQEEAAKLPEHGKQKDAGYLHAPTSVDGGKSEVASTSDTSVQAPVPGPDDTPTVHGFSALNLGVVSEVENHITGAAVGGMGADMEDAAKAGESLSEIEADVLVGSDIECVREGTPAVLDDQHYVQESKSGVATDPIQVNDKRFELRVEANEVTPLEREGDKSVLDFDTCLVEPDHGDGNQRAEHDNSEGIHVERQAGLGIEQNTKSEGVQDIEVKCDSGLSMQEAILEKPARKSGGAISDGGVDEKVKAVKAADSSKSAQEGKNEAICDEVVECDRAEEIHCDLFDALATDAVSNDGEIKSLDIQDHNLAELSAQVPQCVWSGENGLNSFDPEKAVEVQKELNKETGSKLPPILTTERLIVMEDDNTIETEVMVVVGERPLTDGEDESYLEKEVLSSTSVCPAQVLSGASTMKSTSTKASTNLARNVSARSAESIKSASTKPTVSGFTRRVSTAARKTPDPKKTLPQVKEKKTVPKHMDKVSDNGYVKSPPNPAVLARIKRASITAPPSRAKTVSDQSHTPSVFTTHETETNISVGLVKPSQPLRTVVPKRRASTVEPTAPLTSKNGAEQSTPIRNKNYLNVRSKVLGAIQSGSIHAVTHKTITKEDFIAAERRKSLGSAGLRSVLNPADRRASLAARASIDAPPEPFVRSALSRKKMNLTAPRYLDYENSPGYAERSRQQYERRKRLELENAAKSEKRQRELRTFFADKQQKALMTNADEVRRGLEAHEFLKLAKENKVAGQKALKTDRQRTHPSRRYSQAPSTTSSVSSSNCVLSQTSKKSYVSSVEKVITVTPLEENLVGTEDNGAFSCNDRDDCLLDGMTTVTETLKEDNQIPGSVGDEVSAFEQTTMKLGHDESSRSCDDVSVE